MTASSEGRAVARPAPLVEADRVDPAVAAHLGPCGRTVHSTYDDPALADVAPGLAEGVLPHFRPVPTRIAGCGRLGNRSAKRLSSFMGADQLLDVGSPVLRPTQPRDAHGLEPAGNDQAAKRFLRDSEDVLGFASRNQRGAFCGCGDFGFGHCRLPVSRVSRYSANRGATYPALA